MKSRITTVTVPAKILFICNLIYRSFTWCTENSINCTQNLNTLKFEKVNLIFYNLGEKLHCVIFYAELLLVFRHLCFCDCTGPLIFPDAKYALIWVILSTYNRGTLHLSFLYFYIFFFYCWHILVTSINTTLQLCDVFYQFFANLNLYIVSSDLNKLV